MWILGRLPLIQVLDAMRQFVAAVVITILCTSRAYAACPDVEKQFSAYRSALESDADVAQFFSRSYLENLVSGLRGSDDAALLHEARRAKLLTRTAAVNGPGYQITAQCNSDSAALTLTFPKGGDTNSVTFTYIYEAGAWRISKLRLDINPVRPGHGI